MNTNYKKAIKLMALLLTSLLIGFVSAQTYTELFMYGNNITIGTAEVKFIAGANTTTMGGSDAINTAGTTVTFDQIPNIKPNAETTYEQAVNITNGGSAAKNITLTLESTTGNFSTNFDYLNITIIAANGTELGNDIQLVSSGTNVTTSGTISSITNGETWTVRWIINTKADAVNGESFSVTLKVKVE